MILNGYLVLAFYAERKNLKGADRTGAFETKSADVEKAAEATNAPGIGFALDSEGEAFIHLSHARHRETLVPIKVAIARECLDESKCYAESIGRDSTTFVQKLEVFFLEHLATKFPGVGIFAEDGFQIESVDFVDKHNPSLAEIYLADKQLRFNVGILYRDGEFYLK